jgi:hypothetical protein
VIYVYACPTCNSTVEDRRPVERRNVRRPPCNACGRTMDLQLQPVRGVVKNPAVPKANRL